MIRACALVGALAVSTVANAHHSAGIYSEVSRELEGELLEIRWRNPHVQFRLRTVNDAGEEEIWNIESHSIFNLQRGGVTRDMFRVGERVSVTGRESKLSENQLLGTNMSLPDGREVLLWINVISRFDDAPKLQDAVTENRGIYRVWTLPQQLVIPALSQVGEQPFTDAAIAARASWDSLDNFATRCEPEGMPRMMLTPYPLEFIDQGKQLRIRTEYYDIQRTIHMNRSEAPDDAAYSHLGYSVGAWEDNTLTVKTTRINWPYLDNRGTPLSEAVEVIERFTLSEDQSRLDFLITVTDSATFTEPAILIGYWLALGDSIERFDCQIG